MSINSIQSSTGVTFDSGDVDLRTRAKQLNAQPIAKGNGTETWQPSADSATPQQGAGGFDLGAILGQVFQFIAQAFGGTNTTERKAGVQERAEVSGTWSGNGITASGRAAAEVHARAETLAESFVDESGIGVRGGAEASIGASAEVEGSIKTDLGSIGGRARVSAEAYARIYGEARIGKDGLRAAGRAEVGVLASAESNAKAELLGGLVAGTADARAQSGAGAQATARSQVSFDPPEAVIDAKAGAFAGARAGFSAKGGVAGVGYGIEAEAWSGAGVKAEFTAGLDDGKFRFKATLGAALGVGACFTIDIEIDTREIGKMISGVIGAVGKVLGDMFKGVGEVLKPVNAAFGGAQGDGSFAQRLLDQILAGQSGSPLGEAEPRSGATSDESSAEDSLTAEFA
jgi:hypothetical protein